MAFIPKAMINVTEVAGLLARLLSSGPSHPPVGRQWQVDRKKS